MKLIVMAVFDLKAHAFANPFCIGHTDLGKRGFVEAVRTPGNNLNKYPADHALYELGSFDDTTGTYQLHPQPVLVIAGNSLAEAVVQKIEHHAEKALATIQPGEE